MLNLNVDMLNLNVDMLNAYVGRGQTDPLLCDSAFHFLLKCYSANERRVLY
jgi:hypothetical protein